MLQNFSFLRLEVLRLKRLWSLAQKKEGSNRLLVIFKISKKINPEKLAVHTFVFKTVYKNYNIEKVK